MAWCPDVLADKPHPRFGTKILSKKVRLIRRCLRYIFFDKLVSNFLSRTAITLNSKCTGFQMKQATELKSGKQIKI